jgi:hypothetical protein
MSACGGRAMSFLNAAFRMASMKEHQSMIAKKPAPDLIRGGYRFSEKIMLRE